MILFIDGKRSGYGPEQCGETMTVGQLAKTLNNLIEWGQLSADMPVYLSNDNGYTFGEISDYNSFSVGETWEQSERFDVSGWDND